MIVISKVNISQYQRFCFCCILVVCLYITEIFAQTDSRKLVPHPPLLGCWKAANSHSLRFTERSVEFCEFLPNPTSSEPKVRLQCGFYSTLRDTLFLRFPVLSSRRIRPKKHQRMTNLRFVYVYDRTSSTWSLSPQGQVPESMNMPFYRSTCL